MSRTSIIAATALFALSGCATSSVTGRLMEPAQFEIATAAARVVSLGTAGFREQVDRPAVCVGDEFPERNFEEYQAALTTELQDTGRLVVDGRECRQRGNEVETEEGEVRAMAMWVGEVRFRTGDWAVIPIEVYATRDRTFWYEVWVRRYDDNPDWMVDEAFCRPGSYQMRGSQTPRRGGTNAGMIARFCVPIDPDLTGR